MEQIPSSAPGLGFVLEFLREVWALDHSLQSLSKRMASEHGVTGPQRLVIRVIGKFPGVSPGELAGIMCLHPSTLSGVLERLARAKAIRRTTHPRDKRRAQLYLAPLGRTLDRIEAGTVEAVVQRLLAQVPPARITAARGVLRLLTAALTEELAAEAVPRRTQRPGD
jgi:DNA-binding MarR family transcriptional regulator